MYNFTPINSSIGGILIGISVVLYFYFTGRLAGISGIIENTVTSSKNRFSNFLFLLGLIIGPIIFYYFGKMEIVFEITNSLILISLIITIFAWSGSGHFQI